MRVEYTVGDLGVINTELETTICTVMSARGAKYGVSENWTFETWPTKVPHPVKAKFVLVCKVVAGGCWTAHCSIDRPRLSWIVMLIFY